LENSRIPKKRGQLSLDEEAYIRENVNLLSIDAIASNLNRHEGPIKRYINENNTN
jgi:IS30 family transposase